jgi:tetratricopeptide (TPR) repeat protein
MTDDSWYRNPDWNSSVEAAFFAKLGRAKSNKAQYLRIQASSLARSRPKIALQLLDQYFSLGDHFDVAQAHVDAAAAFLSLGEKERAIEAYEAALSVEERRPNVRTQAYLELPLLIAAHKVGTHYSRALDILQQGRPRLVFWVDYFRWHAAHALISRALGSPIEARRHAEEALDAASKESSGFRYHPTVGLVGGSYDSLRQELTRVSSA